MLRAAGSSKGSALESLASQIEQSRLPLDALSGSLLRKQDLISTQLGALLAQPIRPFERATLPAIAVRRRALLPRANGATRAATLESLVKRLEQLVAWVRVRKMQSSDRNNAEALVNELLDRAADIAADM